MESLFHQLSGSTFIFVKNTDQKAANLMYFPVSPLAKTPAWFLEGQFKLGEVDTFGRRLIALY